MAGAAAVALSLAALPATATAAPPPLSAADHRAAAMAEEEAPSEGWVERPRADPCPLRGCPGRR